MLRRRFETRPKARIALGCLVVLTVSMLLPGVGALASIRTTVPAPVGVGTTLEHISGSVSLTGPGLPGHAYPTVPRIFTPPAIRPGGIIDPNLSYASEPAPMGITDFGLTPNWTGYTYATPMFEANATIGSLAASSSTAAGTSVGFQLNAEDVVTGGGATYVFWIQDVANFDTRSRQIVWEDNVWNLSAVGGGLPANSVAGNGTINSGTYYAAVASGQPGSPVTLSEPTTILARIVASNASGTPHVGLEYNDGYGWEIFDNVTFPFLTNGTNRGFLVTGFQYNPAGTYMDAEWDISGPCCGLTQHLGISNLDMGLSYWNGHNLQAVRAAFDYGANTGESMSNVVDHFGGTNATGGVFGHLVNGTGTLGPMYGAADVSTLRISTGNQSSGAITLNGAAVPFQGSLANFTIAPGRYAINLTANGSYLNGIVLNLTAGEFRSIVLAPIPTYPLRFVSVGLPPLTPWSVNVSGALLSGGESLLVEPVRNGSYDYVLGAVPGFAPPSYHGSVSVTGSIVNVTIVWSAWQFSAVFVGVNDPGGVPWSVVVDGRTLSGAGGQLFTTLPNGTYTYVATAPSSVLLSPSAGTINISGSVAQVEIGFSPAPGTIRGSVSPADAVVTLDGQPVALVNGTFNVSVPAGTYVLGVSRAGYHSLAQNLTIAAGATVLDPIVLQAVPGGPPGSHAAPAGFALPGGVWLWAGVAAISALAVGALLWWSRRPPLTPVRRA